MNPSASSRRRDPRGTTRRFLRHCALLWCGACLVLAQLPALAARFTGASANAYGQLAYSQVSSVATLFLYFLPLLMALSLALRGAQSVIDRLPDRR